MADNLAPTIRTFQVFPDVPEPLAPLLKLANNLWWVWQPDAVELSPMATVGSPVARALLPIATAPFMLATER